MRAVIDYPFLFGRSYMKKEKAVEITIKTVFIGNNNMDEIFYNLLRGNMQKRLALSTNLCYNVGVGFPDVHAD
jgi:hypothetical protein